MTDQTDILITRTEELERTEHRLEQENAALKDQLEALQWREIDAKNQPKVGDEIGGWVGSFFGVTEVDGELKKWKWLLSDGWTHYRPLNPPQPEEHHE